MEWNLLVEIKMVETASSMMPLGTAAPEIGLVDTVTGQTVRLRDFEGKSGLLVMFICNHCPYVVHVREELARLGRDYADRDVGIVAISSNDAAAYPDDAPERLAELARGLGFTFPYCHDGKQEVAAAYGAACTPDFFLFDSGMQLAYRGQLDESRPGNGIPPTGEHLRAALDAVIAGEPVAVVQKPSLGCNIKWKR